jgi:hypothetical protein
MNAQHRAMNRALRELRERANLAANRRANLLELAIRDMERENESAIGVCMCGSWGESGKPCVRMLNGIPEECGEFV